MSSDSPELPAQVEESIVGDIRRDSFIKSAKDRAMDKYGLTQPTIFTGAFLDKKYQGRDWTYKKRYVWLNPTDKTFHWAKTTDMKAKHKQVKLRTAKGVRALNAKGFSIFFENGTSINIEGESEQLNNEWVMVLEKMSGPVNGIPDPV